MEAKTFLYVIGLEICQDFGIFSCFSYHETNDILNSQIEKVYIHQCSAAESAVHLDWTRSQVIAKSAASRYDYVWTVSLINWNATLVLLTEVILCLEFYNRK